MAGIRADLCADFGLFFIAYMLSFVVEKFSF